MSDAAEVIEEEVVEEIEAPDWRTEAGIQDNPAFERFKTSADLARSYTELERHQHNQVRFPSEDAGKEDVDKFNVKMADHGFYPTPDQDNPESILSIQRQLGMPAEASGYKFDAVDGFSDPESEGAFKTVAHEIGLTANQAKGIHNWLTGNIVSQQNDLKTEQDKELGILKGEWGAAFDHKISGTDNTVHALAEKVPGLQDTWDSMKSSGAFDATFVRLMDVVGEALGESGAMPTDPRSTMTRDEALERIAEIQGNPEHPANSSNEGNRGYDKAREKYMQLYHLAYGG